MRYAWFETQFRNKPVPVNPNKVTYLYAKNTSETTINFGAGDDFVDVLGSIREVARILEGASEGYSNREDFING